MCRQPNQAGVTAVGRRHTGRLSIGRSNHLHGGAVDMADGISPGPHGGGSTGGGGIGARDAVLSDPAGPWCGPTSAFATIAWARRWRCCLVQLLLMAQQQIAASKAPRTLRTLKRLFLGMRSLVAFQMLEPCKGALAGTANVGTRLVGLGRRKVGWRLGVNHDGRGFE